MLHTTLDLNFETPDLAQHAPDLISKRIKYHLQQESIVYQVRWIIEKLYLTRLLAAQHMSGPTNQNPKIKPLDSPLKLGILLHDLFPESSENLCWAMLDHLFHDQLISMDQIEIISRRKDLQSYSPIDFKSIKVSWDFDNPEYIHGFDLIVICGTSMNVPMLKDLFSNQNMYQTIVIMTIPGILPKRIQSILDSELVVMCNFATIDYKPVDNQRSLVIILILLVECCQIGQFAAQFGISRLGTLESDSYCILS